MRLWLSLMADMRRWCNENFIIRVDLSSMQIKVIRGFHSNHSPCAAWLRSLKNIVTTTLRCRNTTSTGASTPLSQWCISPCFRFPPISEYLSESVEIFSNFPFAKKFLCLAAKISDDFYLVKLTQNFEFSPYFRTINAFSTYFGFYKFLLWCRSISVFSLIFVRSFFLPSVLSRELL